MSWSDWKMIMDESHYLALYYQMSNLAPNNNPVFTGNVGVPTATWGMHDNDTAASTKFVQNRFRKQSTRTRRDWWQAPGAGSTATPTMMGLINGTGTNMVTATGTAIARTIASTNSLTSSQRLGYISAATAGSTVGIRNNAARWPSKCAFSAVFGISDAVYLAASNLFVGLSTTVTAIAATTQPSTLTNSIGVFKNLADTNLSVLSNGTVTALGANFPCNNSTLYLIEIDGWDEESTGNTSLTITNLNTNNSATVSVGAISGFVTFQLHRSNVNTATAVGLDISQVSIETRYGLVN
jgi:hypothetical protein